MAVTLREIANRVGKSVTTVSRALAGYSDVSEETRTQVKLVAEELGYEPNIAAQQLQSRRTNTIAIILPTTSPGSSDPIFGEFLAGVGNEAAKYNFDLLVSTRSPGPEEEEAYLKQIRSRRADGFVVIRTRSQDNRIAILQEHNFPFVAFGRTEENNDFPYIDEESEAGIGLAVEHLFGLGHTRLAWIGAPSNLMFSRHRWHGFESALTSHGLDLDHDLVVEGDLTRQSGYLLAQQLLTLPRPPTAIVACNDLMALGAIGAAQELGLTVGSDVSITGFDDIPMAEHAHPPLTTLHQPLQMIGQMACQMLIKIIRQEPLPERQILLQPTLVVRKSSGPAGPQ
jgi:LacI family transcriptional regulator